MAGRSQQQQPMSFKTVPGRNRTQKWSQAKTYNYDGDEWGGYDPYDEYGSYDEPTQPAPQQTYAKPQRHNSFDAGDERRNFSSGHAEPSRGMSPAAVSNASNGPGRPSADYGSRPAATTTAERTSNDFDPRTRGRHFTNPEQVPPPLSMRASPARSTGSSVAAQPAFPPRKSSISHSSHGDSPAPDARLSPAASAATDKPLPFIRPSDIYKRVPEERQKERASMDSSRPSMDSIQREASPAAVSSPNSSSLGVRRPSLDPVAEARESRLMEPPQSSSLPAVEERASVPDAQSLPEYMPLSSLRQTSGDTEEAQRPTNLSPVLPPVSRISGFGSDFLQSTSRESSKEREMAYPSQSHVQSTISRVMNSPIENSTAGTSTASQFGMPVEATRAPPGQDPASEILAERQYNTSIEATRAPKGSDPASDILAERDHGTPMEASLQHQPSSGFRSVVNTAFDRKDDDSVPPTPISRDNSGSQYSRATDGLSRSNTDSTAGISPIMSRVPFAAVPGQSQPTIAEEPSSSRTPTQSRPASGAHQIPRKPSPSHDRNFSGGSSNSVVQPGYRRGLDPPSSGNSPARTPALEDTSSRRLSTPMSAETVAETPDVPDQAAEVPAPHLEPAATPASEVAPLPSPRIDTDLPKATRGRSGTDYSTREADLAHEVNASPDQPSYSPPVAEESKGQQRLFLRNHTGDPSAPGSPALNTPASPSPGYARPVSPNIAAQGLGLTRSTTPVSSHGGRDSPAKGRVREIATTYNHLEESSRRNSAASGVSSKSSWSNFRGDSQENLAPLQRKGTGGSQLGPNGTPTDDASEGEEEPTAISTNHEQSHDRSASSLAIPRNDGTADVPGDADRPTSFRPHLPGEWVSFGPTPASEQPPSVDAVDETAEVSQSPDTPRASHIAAEAERSDSEPELQPNFQPDTTPTNNKSHSSGNEWGPSGTLNQLKDAGAALGASLMASSGLTSQARDFGSTQPAEVSYPEMQPKVATGEVAGFLRPQALRPSMQRGESTATDYSDMTEGGSTMTEVPPTPPAKDTPDLADVDGASATGQASDRTAEGEQEARPISSYFAGVVPPLRTGNSREASLEPTSEEPTTGGPRPRVFTSLSTDTGAEDMESDRLRKEIVRSLDPVRREEIERESIAEDAERTQDAINAPDNERRVEQGTVPLPANGTGPNLLNRRFSWESKPQASQAQAAPIINEPPREADIAPEMPYERPRSRGLHIVNNDAASDTSPEEETARSFPVVARVPEQAEKALTDSLPVGTEDVVSPISKSQEDLRGEDMQEVQPSPVSEGDNRKEYLTGSTGSPRLPSYHQSDLAGAPPDSTMAPAPLDTDVVPSASPSATQANKPGRIPPFREILAIKSDSQRIETYNDTRKTFADMNTGLSAWLSSMVAKHPEHATFSTENGSLLPPGDPFKHKNNPSILKIPKPFGSSNQDGPPSGSYATDTAQPKTPAREIDMDKVQQRGKDLMKNASVLGGKAQAGAKGLFAKGRNRFGAKRESGGGEGGKARSSKPVTATPPPPRSTTPKQASRAPPDPPVLPPSSLTVADSPIRASSTSPAPRSQTPTPSSVTTSRSLSRTFSRLRERSRSISTSRSTPRPRSVVLANSEISERSRDDGLDGLGEPATADMEADAGAGSSDDRVEDWNLPGAVVAPATPERSTTPSRLGVLPSPRAETFSDVEFSSMEIASAGEDVTNVDSSAIEEPRTETSKEVAVTDVHPEAQDTGKVPDADLDASKQEHGQAERSLHGVVEAGVPDPAPARPQHQRKISALSTLPSQRRALVSSRPATPKTPTISSFRQMLEGERLYTGMPGVSSDGPSAEVGSQNAGEPDASSPTTAGSVTPRQGQQGEQSSRAALGLRQSVDGNAPASTGVDDSAGVSPPTQPFGVAGASVSGAPMASDSDLVQDDRRSEVSAEDSRDVAQSQEVDHLPDSQRSSISSLGSPDTVIGQRASMIALQNVRSPIAPLEVMGSSDFQNKTVSNPVATTAFEPVGRQTMPGNDEDTALQYPQRSLSSHAATSDHHRFMNRSYRGQAGPPGRAFSYVHDGSSGAPAHEPVGAHDMAEEEQDPNVDVSGMGGVPVGAASIQQHPFFRNSGIAPPPSDYEEMRASRSGTTTPFTHSRQVSGESGGQTSRRYSDFFRGPSPGPDGAIGASAGLPPPNAIGAEYGLEGLDMTVADAQTPAPLRDPDEQQVKRRSGIWEAFKRTPSTLRPRVGTPSPVAPVDSRVDLVAASPAAQLPEDKARLKKLKKPQRAASAATPPPVLPKKKSRLSRLGSIFGRSKKKEEIEAAAQPKVNKLTKLAPPSQGQPQPYGHGPSRAAKGYDAYEAMRRQQIPDLQRRNTGASAGETMSSPYQQAPPQQAVPAAAPPQGYYGPNESQPPKAGSVAEAALEGGYNSNGSPLSTPYEQPASPQRPRSRSQYRSLHSERFQRGLAYASIPEAFRPTEAAYGAAAEPIPPPLEQRPRETREPTRQPTLPNLETPGWQTPPAPSSVHRQSSSGAAAYPFPSPSRSSAEHQRQRSRDGSLPPTSPSRSSATPAPYSPPPGPPPQHRRMSSLDEEVMAYSPAQKYPAQQTPWSISMPPASGQPRPPRTPPWPRSSPTPQQQMYAPPNGPPPGFVGYRRDPSRTQSMQSRPAAPSAGYENYYPPDWALRARSPSYGAPHQRGPQYYSQRPPPPGFQRDPYDIYPPQRQQPPYYPQAGPSPPRQQQQSQHSQQPQQQQQRPPQQRYYHRQQQPPSRPPSAGRPLTYQRTNSGFSGRRDDMGVSEAELALQFHYPGQEWPVSRI